jgi:hypothetical protein
MVSIAPLVSNAEIIEHNIKISCDDTSIIFNTLKKDYKEIPFVLGKTSDIANTVMSLWVNPASKTWTILSTKNDITCVIGVGDKLELIVPKAGSTH